MADLGAVGLIRYDATEAVVMICKWFDHNPINNPKHLMGSVKAFQRLPSMTSFLPDLAVDIMASATVQAQKLQAEGVDLKRSSNAKSREFGDRKIESAAQMLEQMVVLKEAVLADPARLNPLAKAIERLPDRIRETLSEGLSIPLSKPVTIHMRQETQTQTQTQTQTSDTDTGAVSAVQLAAEYVEKGRATK